MIVCFVRQVSQVNTRAHLSSGTIIKVSVLGLNGF